ncbi:MAG: ABC transporter ATP-binding protein [Thermoprotei archaeon]|nr:MAG: ABC transporter ATP-binding protein [Thermoprotei archaeon]
MDDSIIVKLVKVKKAYRIGSNIFWALKGLDLEVKRGEFVAIMGPSGSGKTTLLNMIGLLDKPTSGTIIIDGITTSSLDGKALALVRNRKIGFVFQQFNLVSRLTVYENIELPLVARGLPKNIRKKMVTRALLLAGGELSWLSKKPLQLSGGQQQRVAIARALVNNPAIILADEPTGNLDRKSAKNVIKSFKEVNAKGQTIIMVTHDPETANCTDRILLIRDGKIVGEEVPNFDRCILNTVD